MSERRESLQIRKNVGQLHQVLEALQRNKDKYSDPVIKKALLESFGTMLWEVLPKHVTTVNVDDGTTLARPEGDVRFIPLNQREAWNLPRVDQYGAKLSQSIQQEWRPVFPPPPAK